MGLGPIPAAQSKESEGPSRPGSAREPAFFRLAGHTLILPKALALLFLAGAVANLVTAEYAESLAGFGIAAFLGLTALYTDKGYRDSVAFSRILLQNAPRLAKEGSLILPDRVIKGDMALIRFEIVASFIFFTDTAHSAWLPEDREGIGLHRLFCTLATFLLGWWALPRGPLVTVRALHRNLRGGTKRTIRELLAGDPDNGRPGPGKNP